MNFMAGGQKLSPAAGVKTAVLHGKES